MVPDGGVTTTGMTDTVSGEGSAAFSEEELLWLENLHQRYAGHWPAIAAEHQQWWPARSISAMKSALWRRGFDRPISAPPALPVGIGPQQFIPGGGVVLGGGTPVHLPLQTPQPHALHVQQAGVHFVQQVMQPLVPRAVISLPVRTRTRNTVACALSKYSRPNFPRIFSKCGPSEILGALASRGILWDACNP